jgi:hypothetical protein
VLSLSKSFFASSASRLQHSGKAEPRRTDDRSTTKATSLRSMHGCASANCEQPRSIASPTTASASFGHSGRPALTNEPRLLSADTFGTLAAISKQLSIPAQVTPSAEEKLAILRELGAGRCAAVGNGANDALMLGEAALGIAPLGPEGASGAALQAADLICRSVLEALELLLEPRTLAATLRL